MRIICLTKTEDLFSHIWVSYEKDTTKDSEAKQLIKPWPYQTLPIQNGRNSIRCVLQATAWHGLNV